MKPDNLSEECQQESIFLLEISYLTAVLLLVVMAATDGVVLGLN